MFDDFPGDHAEQLVAMFQLAKLPLIAVQRDLYLARCGFADDRLYVIEGFVGRCLRCRSGLDPPRLAGT
ncbi:hypothetical protein D9M73_263320 [compost metagenome]